MSISRWSPPRLCRSTTASTTRPTWTTSTWSRRSSLMPWQRTTFLRLLGIFLSWCLDHDAPALSFYQDFFSGCMELLSSTVAAISTTLSSGKTFALEVWYNFLLHKLWFFETKLFFVEYQHALSGSGEPEGDLEAAIVRDFGSVAAMKEKLSASTVAVQVGLEFDVVRNKICYSLTQSP